MNNDTDKLIKQLKKHEGVDTHPYVDTVGKLTIGVGRNLADNGLRDNEIEFLLMNDIADVIKEAQSFAWYDELNTARKAVIVNMLFNLGMPRFSNFKNMLAALDDGDHRLAAVEMVDSKWAFQVGKRSEELAKQMLTGEWQ